MGPRSRVRAVAAAVLVLAVASISGLGAVRGRADDERLDRLEAQARENARAGERLERARERGGGGGSGDGGNGLSDFLEALAGSSSGAGGDLESVLLDACGPVFEEATAHGTAGLFGGRAGEEGGVGEQVRQVVAALEELRGLRFRSVPAPVYLDPDELEDRIRELSVGELDPAALATETRALVALGALPPGSDLRHITVDALGEQVAGFYDPESGELVVGSRSGSTGLDGLTRAVLAHELDHALADQALGLPVPDGPSPPGREDQDLARLALVEGDATLAMQLYVLRHVSLVDQLSGLAQVLGSEEQLAALPHHLRRRFGFPYVEGLAFACALHTAGGWDAVDRAYRSPPTTSAQVLFPERFGAGEGAVDPRDPPAPGTGWAGGGGQSFGAADLQWLLEAPGGDPARALDGPRDRAAAWAGGEWRVWTAGDRTAVGLALVQRAGERPLCATMAAWYAAAFAGGRPAPRRPGEELALDGTDQDAVVRCAGADVRIGIAPDLATARLVAG